MAEGQDEVFVDSGRFSWKEIQRRFNAVCRLAFDKRSSSPKIKRTSATGFLATCQIGTNQAVFILCNHHFLKSPQDTQNIQVSFLFHDKNEKSVDVCLDPDVFFCTDETLDYTMVGITEQDLKKLKSLVSPMELKDNNQQVRLDDFIVIPQHPNGKPKELSWNKVVHIEDNMVFYKADTDPGSSGSPVLHRVGNDLQVLALHKAGGVKLKNGESANMGILISVILKHISRINPEYKTKLTDTNESGCLVSPVPETDPTDVGSSTLVSSASSTRPVQVSSGSDSVCREKESVCCDKEFTPKELIKIAQEINSSWIEVAQFTNEFQSWEISNINGNNNFQNPVQKANEMLQKYKSRLGSRERLACAIDYVLLRDVANKVRQGSLI